MYEGLLVPVLMNGNDAVVRREKERSRIIAVQLDSLKSLLDVKRIGKILNIGVRELCGMKKKGIDESVIWWFGVQER